MSKRGFTILAAVFVFCAGRSTRAQSNGEVVFWGADTNGLRCGVQVRYSRSRENSPTVSLIPYLKKSSGHSESTNPKHTLLWIPPEKSRFRIEISDDKGNELAKGPEGRSMGRPLDQPLRLREGVNYRAGYLARILLDENAEQLPEVFLQDYFKFAGPGKYYFKFSMRVIWLKEGSRVNLRRELPPLTDLPVVKGEIRINSDE